VTNDQCAIPPAADGPVCEPCTETSARIRKLQARGVIVLDTYRIISTAIECAIPDGIERAHKHTDSPSRGHLAECIELAIMNALAECIDWEAST